MAVSASFVSVLLTLAGTDNKDDRQDLTLLLGGAAQQLGDDLVANCRSLQESRERAEAHLSLVLTLRTLWSIIPERLFTAADPNFERLAHTSLELLGPGKVDGGAIHGLSIVYRRLRSAQQDGRRGVTSFDLGRASHRRILAEQSECCALCRYSFARYQLAYAEADAEDNLFDEHRVPIDGEVVLERYHRRPVLDHIIPQFLGGDGPENWQVLCQSCNGGKGDGLAWILRRGFLPPVRPTDARTITPSLRFAVLSHHHAVSDIRGTRPERGGELLLYRRDPGRLPVFDNLMVRIYQL